MKIKEVCELTGLSKKAIYYYINHGLLEVKRDSINGYHEFTPENIQQLENIKILRELGFNTEDIKGLIIYPTMVNFFFYKTYLNKRLLLYTTIKQLDHLDVILQNLFPNITTEQITLSKSIPDHTILLPCNIRTMVLN